MHSLRYEVKKISGVLNLMMKKHNLMPKKLATIFVVLITILSMAVVPSAQACSRLVYNGGLYGPITARSMDWYEEPHTKIWVFPKGMERDGGVDDNSITWTSKYGSVVTSSYDFVSVDGMNDQGLVANALFLQKGDFGTGDGNYGTVEQSEKTLAIGAWVQYVLDNYATVENAYEELITEPFQIVTVPFGKLVEAGRADISVVPEIMQKELMKQNLSLHLAISDRSGNSAIFEYKEGVLNHYYGEDKNVLTNDPFYDMQVNFNSYWDYINAKFFRVPGVPFPVSSLLPGSNDASSRFIRASYYLKEMNDKAKAQSSSIAGRRNELAAALGILRNVSDPLGLASLGPNTTQWRAVSSQNQKPESLNYYFEYTKSPYVFWLNLGETFKRQNEHGGFAMVLENITDFESVSDKKLVGEVSAELKKTEPFSWDLSSLNTCGRY